MCSQKMRQHREKLHGTATSRELFGADTCHKSGGRDLAEFCVTFKMRVTRKTFKSQKIAGLMEIPELIRGGCEGLHGRGQTCLSYNRATIPHGQQHGEF